MKNVINWNKDVLNNFTLKDQIATHNLHLHPAFSEENLIRILDKYPKEDLGVFTMGYNPKAWGEWVRGRPGNLNGEQLMQAVKNGRIWLNLRRSNLIDEELQEILDKMFKEINEHTGVMTFKHDLGILISSPNAHVFYHADMPLVVLMQIKGIKRVFLYPPQEPYINDEQAEAIALKETDEQLKYNPEWETDAFIHDLRPGELLSWRQNAPHAIVNHDCVNVSLSVEYMTAESLWRANLLYANGLLRRKHKMNPKIEKSLKLAEPFKIAYARANKANGCDKKKDPRPAAFTLDENDLGKLIFDNGEIPEFLIKKEDVVLED